MNNVAGTRAEPHITTEVADTVEQLQRISGVVSKGSDGVTEPTEEQSTEMWNLSGGVATRVEWIVTADGERTEKVRKLDEPVGLSGGRTPRSVRPAFRGRSCGLRLRFRRTRSGERY